MENKEKFGKLGKPSLVFGPGQKKRLALIKKCVDFKGTRVLDVGCGIGLYANALKGQGAEVVGIDTNKENIEQAQAIFPDIVFNQAQGEHLPFKPASFDIVLLNEVLEHVEDDKKTAAECLRVLRPGGKIIIFAPNKGFPFETHGIYLGDRYIFGNIPFLSWAPGFIRKYFTPHTRIYTLSSLKKLFSGKQVCFSEVDFLWPAFDRIERKIPILGKLLKNIGQMAGKSFLLKRLGISIFLIVEKL